MILFLLIFGVVTGGMAMDAYATREQILELAGFTEEEAGNAQIDDFIINEAITEERLQLLTREKLRPYIQELIDNAPISFMRMIFLQTLDDETAEKCLGSELKTLSLMIMDGMQQTSLVVDVSNRRVYGSPYTSIFENVREAEIQFDLDERTEAAMYAILQQNDLHGLKHLYEGTYKNMYSWSLALEYEQGIVRYEKCFANNGAPDVLEEIGTQLLDLFEIQ